MVFTPLGPLPEGRVAIEASAGTGKTYTLAGLVVRYVAEAGVAVERILIVTFTRAAAAELRDRVRSRLTEAVTALRGPAGTEVADDLLALVASTDRERRLSRSSRLSSTSMLPPSRPSTASHSKFFAPSARPPREI